MKRYFNSEDLLNRQGLASCGICLAIYGEEGHQCEQEKKAESTTARSKFRPTRVEPGFYTNGFFNIFKIDSLKKWGVAPNGGGTSYFDTYSEAATFATSEALKIVISENVGE